MGEDEDDDQAGGHEGGDGQEVERPSPPSVRRYEPAHQDRDGYLAHRNGYDAEGLRYPVDLRGLLELCGAQVDDVASAAFGGVEREEYGTGCCERLKLILRIISDNALSDPFFFLFSPMFSSTN